MIFTHDEDLDKEKKMIRSVTQTLEIPVRNECDILVVGAGPAGIGAALTAARKGARVTLAIANRLSQCRLRNRNA